MDEKVKRVQFVISVWDSSCDTGRGDAERALAEPEMLADRAEPTVGERMAQVRSRWEAGEWVDLVVCHDQVDLARAKAELAAQSDLGQELMRITERAIEMVLEDAGVRRKGWRGHAHVQRRPVRAVLFQHE